MSDWIRRDFSGIGVTQSPPGRHLAALQERHVGKVLLCIDVSNSMVWSGNIAHALAGARTFVADAVAANYRIGLILWHDSVERFVPLSTEAQPVLAGLAASFNSSGTNVSPALRLGITTLGPLTGDRVMAIFGDGDIGPPAAAVALSRQATELGIRIIVRGLGEYAAAQLQQIATDPAEAARSAVVARPEDLVTSIPAMMASALTARRRPTA